MRILAGLILLALWYRDNYLVPLLGRLRQALLDLMGPPMTETDEDFAKLMRGEKWQD